MKDQERYAIACHEAGHVLIQYILGGKLNWVSMDMGAAMPGCTSHDDLNENDPNDRTKTILILSGGGAAERVMGCDRYNVWSDLADICCIKKIAQSSIEFQDEFGQLDEAMVSRYVEEQGEVAFQMLAANKDQLIRIADRIYTLTDGEMVSGEELYRIYMLR